MDGGFMVQKTVARSMTKTLDLEADPEIGL